MKDKLQEKKYQELRQYERTGRPLGSDLSIDKLTTLLGKQLRNKKTGPKGPWEERGTNNFVLCPRNFVSARLWNRGVADTWRKRRENARLLFPAVSSLATALIFIAAMKYFTGSTQYIVLLLGGMTAIMFVPGVQAVTQDVMYPGLRATSYSLCVVVQVLLGSSFGPIFVGAISDRYDIQTAMTILPFSCLIAALLFFIGSFFYEGGLKKVEKVRLNVEK